MGDLAWETVNISSRSLKAVCKLGQVQRRNMGMIKEMESLPNVKWLENSNGMTLNTGSINADVKAHFWNMSG